MNSLFLYFVIPVFRTEVMQSLLRAYRQSVETENVVLEINSSKFAYNMSFKEVTIGITKGILSIAPKAHSEFYEQFTPKVQWEKIKDAIIKLKSILIHYVTTSESQWDLMQALEVIIPTIEYQLSLLEIFISFLFQEYANDNDNFRPMLIKALHLLYDEDILPEEAILLWHKTPSLYEAGAELRVMVGNKIMNLFWKIEFKTESI